MLKLGEEWERGLIKENGGVGKFKYKTFDIL
jgi:hypothetical protein